MYPDVVRTYIKFDCILIFGVFEDVWLEIQKRKKSVMQSLYEKKN